MLEAVPAWFVLACLHGHFQLPWHLKVPQCLRTENPQKSGTVALGAIFNTFSFFFFSQPEEYLANTYI